MENGLITLECKRSPIETLENLKCILIEKGLRIFAEIDHSANARAIGEQLRPTILLIFGHPKGGTPIMQACQPAGIDLPFKVLVWEDENDRTWLTYNDPIWLQARHGLENEQIAAFNAIASGMAVITSALAAT
jgi:uncharacterized protein (DUF302 family)